MIIQNKMSIWQQSTKIFEKLVDLPQEQALTRLKLINDIPESVKTRVEKLIKAVDKENKVLEVVNSGNVFQQLKAITDLTGKTINNYKVEELIAIGGMSYIYKAHRIDTKVQKPVALKVMSLNKSQATLALFHQEQQTLSKLNHPNIVSFLHGGQTDQGIYYLVTEFIEGAIPLDAYIEKNNINKTKIVCMIKKIANAMKFAHENLIIHGDLKTDNILVDKRGNIKIIDFGISAFTYKQDKNAINAYTPEIASPEQIKGEKITTKTDVFSLAATLLQLLIKDSKLPEFSADTYDEKEDEKYVKKLLAESDLDNDLCNILIRALRTDSFKRYFTMFDFAKDLHKWSLNKPISATKHTKTYRLKKFILRNPTISALSSLLVVSLFISFFVISNYIKTANNEADKANTTLSLFSQIFSVSNPIKINDPNLTVKETLDFFVDNKLNKLTLAPEIRLNLNLTIANIYTELSLINQAEKLYKQALTIPLPKNNKNSLTLIEIKLNLAKIMIYSNDPSTTTQSLNEVYNELVLSFPSQHDLILDTMTALMDSFYNTKYNTVEAQQLQEKILSYIDSGKVKETTLLMDGYNALAARAQFTTPKNYQNAEKFLMKSMELAKESSDDQLYSMYQTNRALSFLYYQQNKYQESAQLMSKTIKELAQLDVDSPYLSRLNSGYSSILFKLGQYDKSLDALTTALTIANKNNNQNLIYSPLSKRAMYHVRLNQFQLGLQDQLDLIAITVAYKKDKVVPSLMNLAYMLYAADYSNLGNRLIQYSLKNMNQNLPNFKVTKELYLLNAGLLNWSEGNTSQANSNYLVSLEYLSEKNQAKHNLLNTLINYDQNNIVINDGVKQTLISRLIALLTIKTESSAQFQQQIESGCQLPTNYKLEKIIAIKELYLNTCMKLYQSLSKTPPKNISNELSQINSAKKQAHLVNEKLITRTLHAYL